MRGREQIGTDGLATLMLLFLLGSSTILSEGVQAGRSAWLAILAGGAVGLLFLRVYTLLHSLCDGQSLIAYTQTLLGRWPGRIVGLLYLWYGLHLGALVLRNYVDALQLTVLPETPSWAATLAIVSVCAYAVRLGLEPLTRGAQIVAVYSVLQLLTITMIIQPHAHIENLLPILDQGIRETARATFSVFGFPFGEAVLFALLLHRVDRSKPIWNSARNGMVGAMLLLALGAARYVAVLGANAAKAAQYPNYWAIQVLGMSEFVPRFDALIISGWIGFCVIKVAVCLHVTASGLAQWAGLPGYKTLVFPVATWMAALSILVYRNVGEQTRFAAYTWPFYSLPFQVLIPLVLLALAWFRKSRRTVEG